MNRRSDGIADTQLKIPVARPVFRLFILANLHEDKVAALLQAGAHDELVHGLVPVIFILAEQVLSVEPKFPGVFRTEAQFSEPVVMGEELSQGVGCGAFERSEWFVHAYSA